MNLAINKVNLNNVFNKNEEQYRAPNKSELEDKNKLMLFQELFEEEIISYDKLKKLSWDGIPSRKKKILKESSLYEKNFFGKTWVKGA